MKSNMNIINATWFQSREFHFCLSLIRCKNQLQKGASSGKTTNHVYKGQTYFISHLKGNPHLFQFKLSSILIFIFNGKDF